jgi:phage terminase large subunit-like protein
VLDTKSRGREKPRDHSRGDTSAHSSEKSSDSAPFRYTLPDFRRYARKLKTENGKPFEIKPFQAAFLKAHFSGIPELVVVMPKGNGKTTILSALALFHLETVPGADVYIAATSIRQARILFRQAAAMVIRSGMDNLEVKSGYGEIRFEGDVQRVGPRIQVVSSEAGGEDGAIPTLALIDELHRHRDGDLYGVFRDGLAKRSGQMITISTAGAALDSPLGKFRVMAHEHESFRRTGVLNTARWESFAWFEWCLRDTDDTQNLALVAKANPLLSVADLRQRRDSPTTTPGAWLRFACGIWTEGEDPWVTPSMWDPLRTDIGGVVEGEEVTVAVRVGAAAGIAIAAERHDGHVAVKVEILHAPIGGRLAYESVEYALRRIAERYTVLRVGFDPDQFQRSAEILQEAGLPMMEVPQRPKRLAGATSTLWRLISGGLLAHDGDPDLRAQVFAGRTKETVEGYRLEPTADTAGLIALAMACHMITEQPAETPAFVAL